MQKDGRDHAANLFSFDNKFVLEGDAVTDRQAHGRVRKKGTGPLYFNAYLTNFTLEDFITKAGLEIKVNRKYYKLVKADKTIKAAGSRGQAVDQKVEKYERAGAGQPGARSRAATWSRSSWRSTARTTTSTWCSRT